MASAASSSAQLILFFLLTCFLILPLSLDAQETHNSVALLGSPPPFSFSFDFSNESSYNAGDFLFEGNASVHGDVIDLTCNSYGQSINGCTGRMSYNHPVPFYDNTTLASFSTSFTFVIMSENNSTPADGMAFFLSGYPSRMPRRSGGGNLGLLNETSANDGRFVAVEFDTYQNPWDPSGNHIGIDINSVDSVDNTSLGRSLNGTMTATITFDNMTHMLAASLKFHDDPSVKPVVVTNKLQDPKSLLPSEVAVGFSAATGSSVELHQILAWSFNSTLAPTTHKGQDNKKTMIIIGSLVGLVLLVLVSWFIVSCCKWSNRNRDFEKQGKQEPTRFKYRDLAAATDHFSDDRKLGEGFFGVVYRGYLKKSRCEVAVKKILNKSHAVTAPTNKNFDDELNAITSVKHKNLVKLVGWCRGNRWNFFEFMCWCWKNKNNELFLVYELVPKGNLHDHLHKEENILPWEARYKIVKDIACALLYLHHECDPVILHRDIKPSNILLDNNFNAKLADFGLSRIADDGCSKILTTPVGTERYLDPECKKPVVMVEFSRSSDVYSFGIVLLEIACGQRVFLGMFKERVWEHYIKRSLLQDADAKLKGEFARSEMESVIILGLWCSYPDSKKRPSMEQVMAVLEHGKPLPDLMSLGTASVSTQQETYMDPQGPSSAGSSSYEQHA